MSTNHEAVAALPVPTAAVKSLLRAMAVRRFIYCLDGSESATNFVAVDPDAGTIPLYLLQNSVIFQFDPTDTTTPHDGVTCLVSSDGKRFKYEKINLLLNSLLTFSDISGLVLASQLPNPSAVTLGGVKSLAAVTHKWINQIGTDGQPAATQPAAADLSDGTTGSGPVVLGTAPTITGMTLAMFAANVADTDGTFAANSDTRLATQKAVKTYVDTAAQGLDAKPSVLVATTANITLSGEQTIDGTLTSASRVLVKNQTTTANNGIYVSAAGSWARALDADAWTELPGAFAFVEKGTVNGDCGFVCTVDAGGTLGTTAVTFTQFSGAGTYTAGTGLTLTGTSFAIDSTVVTLTGTQSLSNKTIATATFTGVSSFPAGSVGAPSINLNTLGTGLYSPASSYIGFAYNGAIIAGMDGGVRFNLYNSSPLQWDAGTGAGDVGLVRATVGVLYVGTGTLSASGATFASKNNTPSTLASGTTNNYSLGVATSYFQRIAANASNSVLTGLTLTNAQVDGQEHMLVNVATSGTLTLNHQDTNSTAANRFLCSTGANIVLSANQAADVIYDGTVSRWLVFKRN